MFFKSNSSESIFAPVGYPANILIKKIAGIFPLPRIPLFIIIPETASMAKSDGIIIYIHRSTASDIYSLTSLVFNIKNKIKQNIIKKNAAFFIVFFIFITVKIILLNNRFYSDSEVIFLKEDKSSIHIAGNYEIFIENCRRIEEYNEVLIKVKTKKLYIEVWGNDLRAFDFKTNSLIIRGKISHIEFTEKGDKV